MSTYQYSIAVICNFSAQARQEGEERRGEERN